MYGGKHFVTNSLCAVAVGLQNGIEISKILDGINQFELTKNRMEIIQRKDNIRIINDTYNANYDSMKASLEYLGETKSTRKIAILGNMGELGDYTKELHEKVGEEVYKNKIDILITVGESAEYFAKKAESLGMKTQNIFVYSTKEEAIKKAKEIIKNGDYILVKASNSMNFKEIVENIA